MVCLSGNQSIDYIHGGGKEDLDVGIASGIGDAFGQEGLPRTRIANENDITVGRDKVEMKQLENAIFLILSGAMVIEVELVNGELFFEAGTPPPLENGALPAVLDFDVREQVEGRDDIEIFAGGLL